MTYFNDKDTKDKTPLKTLTEIRRLSRQQLVDYIKAHNPSFTKKPNSCFKEELYQLILNKNLYLPTTDGREISLTKEYKPRFEKSESGQSIPIKETLSDLSNWKLSELKDYVKAFDVELESIPSWKLTMEEIEALDSDSSFLDISPYSRNLTGSTGVDNRTKKGTRRSVFYTILRHNLYNPNDIGLDIEALTQNGTELKLTELQHSLILGLLLSDAHISFNPSDKNVRMSFGQSMINKPLVEHFTKVLEPIMAPRGIKQGLNKGKDSDPNVRFVNFSARTRRLEVLKPYREAFRSINNTKTVPTYSYLMENLTWGSLAYMIMGDGSAKDEGNQGLIINLQGFSKSALDRLCLVLNTKFKLMTWRRDYYPGANYTIPQYQLVIGARSLPLIRDNCLPFFITVPHFLYKVPREARTIFSNSEPEAFTKWKKEMESFKDCDTQN